MSIEDWIKTLELLVPIAKAVPLLGSPVEGSLEAAVKILQLAQGVKTNKEQTKELAEQAARWTQTLVNALDKVKTDTAELEHLRPNVTPIREALDAIAKAIERRANQSVAKQLISRSKNEQELAKLRANLRDAHERFMVSSQISHQTALSTLLTTADADTLNQLKPVSSSRYDSLASPPGCLAGTRQEILAQMLTWAEEPCQGFSVFWLAGLAGTGKSSIAKTFCEQTAVKNILMATFFASRSSADRRDPFNIIHTLAYELSIADSRIRPQVLSAIRSPPDIMQRPMREQVERLMLGPLSQVLSGRLLVLVIDALDECEKVDGMEGGALIPLLADMLRSLPVKLVVTSRQETSLVGMFDSLVHISLRLHDVATEVVEPDVRCILEAGFAKIRRDHKGIAVLWPSQEDLDSLVQLTGQFFIFAATALRYIGDRRFTPAEQLGQVLARGATLDGETPYAQIDALYTDILRTATCSDSAGSPNPRLLRRVGQLVRTVVLLEESLSVSSLALLMGASEIDVAKDTNALAAVLLLTMNGNDQSTTTVRIFHPSFRDFLSDSQRCQDSDFLVRSAEHHHALAHRCLVTMNNSLTRDICHLQNPLRPNSDIGDLAERIVKYVPGALQYAGVFWSVHLRAGESEGDLVCTTLLEFCRMHLFHWVELVSLLACLSAATAQLPSTISWCRSLGSSTAGQASEILYDAYRMLLAYYTPIFSHALHVYESAVPTMPKCALFATVNADTAAGARLLSARQAGWTATLRVIETHAGEVNSVAFSPDGTHIVSGSRDTTVRLWSASVGDPLAIFIGHAGSVKCVAFSPNGTKIASGSVDCTVRLWDARTHKELAILHTLGKVTRSVSFSPNGSLIAITLDSHKSVCVWNPAAEEHVFVLEGHEDRVAAVFSPDGSRIIFASDTGIVRVWNSRTDLREVAMQGHDSAVTSVSFSPDKDWFVSAAKTQVRVGNMRTRKIACVSQGHFLDKVKSLALSPNGQRVVLGFADATVHVWGETSGVLQGHLSRVESVAISPDGTQIASGSADETIRVWDIRAGSAFTYQDNSNASPSHELVISPTGSHLVSIVANFGRVWDMQTYEQIATLEGHASIILLVTFSLNGAHIITGSSDKTVRVWDTRTGVQLAVMNCDPETVSAVAISPDGTQVVSGSTTNGKLRVWDVLTAKKVAIFVGHESQVQAVVFSPDGVWIASGSDDNTARVWDIQRRKQHRVFKGHQSSVSSVAFSPDGSRLVSGSRDKTIRVWDINMRVQIGLVVHDRWRPVVGFTSNGDRICTRNGRGIELVWDFQDMSTRYQRDPERNVRVSACATPSTTDNMSEADAGHKENYNENAIAWNGKTGWLSCTTNTSGLLPLCWLPAGNRGPVIIRGWVAAVSGLGGKVTVLDFTDTIERLQSLGIM